MRDFQFARWAAALALAAARRLGGMLGSGTDAESTLTVAGDVPIAYAKRVHHAATSTPPNGAPFAAGGDLMIREKSSPSAREFNVTAAITQGKGDVSDPEVSYDGKKIVFAMRCPTSNTSTVGGVAGLHRSLEHLGIRHVGGRPVGRQLPPHHQLDDRRRRRSGLPAGRPRLRVRLEPPDDDQDPGARPDATYAVDEYERERVFNLHTVDRNGGAVTQISVNQSHDRNPVVRPNGDIMFSRWEHVGPRNRFAIFRVKPDGTDMFVLYGAHSGGNSFLHPRDMDPSGPYKGKVVSSLMPLSGTQEGGALMLIDAANYSEQNTPANAQVAAAGWPGAVDREGDRPRPRPVAVRPHHDAVPAVGRHQPRAARLPPVRGDAQRRVVPCVDADRRRARDAGRRHDVARAAGAACRCRTTCPPSYAIYMFDPAEADVPDRRRAAAGLHVHGPGRDPAAPGAERDPADRRRRDARGAEPGADRSAQRLRHRRPRSHGRLDAGAGRPRPPGAARRIAKTAPIDAADTRAQVPTS